MRLRVRPRSSLVNAEARSLDEASDGRPGSRSSCAALRLVSRVAISSSYSHNSFRRQWQRDCGIHSPASQFACRTRRCLRTPYQFNHARVWVFQLVLDTALDFSVEPSNLAEADQEVCRRLGYPRLLMHSGHQPRVIRSCPYVAHPILSLCHHETSFFRVYVIYVFAFQGMGCSVLSDGSCSGCLRIFEPEVPSIDSLQYENSVPQQLRLVKSRMRVPRDAI